MCLMSSWYGLSEFFCTLHGTAASTSLMHTLDRAATVSSTIGSECVATMCTGLNIKSSALSSSRLMAWWISPTLICKAFSTLAESHSYPRTSLICSISGYNRRGKHQSEKIKAMSPTSSVANCATVVPCRGTTSTSIAHFVDSVLKLKFQTVK